MSSINRQKYMAELSKLLSFMFKEDRSEILREYNEMLDNAEDEQALLESFGSPTKLAVTIAHSYNSGERGAVVPSAKEKPEPAGQAEPESQPEPEKPQEPEISYVDIIEDIRREKAAEEGIEYKPIFFNEEPDDKPEIEVEIFEDDTPAEETPAEEAPAEEAPAEEAPVEEVPAEEAPAEEALVEEVPAEEAPVEEAPAEEAPDEEAPVEEAPAEEAPAEEAPIEEAPIEEAPAEEAPAEEVPASKPVLVRKTRPGLVVLYLIPAIPIGLALMAAAAAIGLGIIAISVFVFITGFKLLAFSFSGMDLIANILLSLGVTIAVIAVGLLLIWLGIWVIAVGVPGAPRLMVALGRRLCTKEVEANG